ncbi:MAG: hypothetical protein ACXWWA_12095 [Chitinophagaceae bacterium]
MWSEEINKKIQEAENSLPTAHNDKAWENMETLLDRHLPLKKRRRRFIWLMIPLFLGAATTFFILQKTGNKSNPAVGQKNTSSKTILLPVDQTSPGGKLPGIGTNEPISSKDKSAETHPLKETFPELASKTNLQQAATGGQLYERTKKINRELPTQNIDEAKAGKETRELSTNSLRGKPVASNIQAPVINITQNNDAITTVPADSLSLQKTIADNKKMEDTVQSEITRIEPKKEKSKSSAGSKFSLNFSFGPDISGVGIDNPGRLEMQYGIGASYALSKRFSIRTGFFAGSKKYTADSADYHLHYSINNLQKVEADCYVYEIPLTLVYNFPSTKKHNWFLSGGVSSFLMKKETYEYYYKNSWGQPQSYSRTYKNENSHLFSVINISGGYQYHFTDRFTVMAEPYIKLPGSGIGAGKVKLKSSGVLFTIGYKPFLKSK